MIVIRDTTPILFEETFVFLKEKHERIEFNISNTETGEKKQRERRKVSRDSN